MQRRIVVGCALWVLALGCSGGFEPNASYPPPLPEAQDSPKIYSDKAYLLAQVSFPDALEPATGETTEQAGAPDLVMASITYTPSNPQVGNSVVFTATVTNIGDGPSPEGPVLTVVYQNAAGETIAYSDAFVSSIAAGASVDLVSTGNWIAVEGNHSILATVDHGNLISESNEDNNTITASIRVTAPVPASNALPAFRFVDSIGVNTHFAFTWSPYYTMYPQIKDRLIELGVRHIRDGSGNNPRLYKAGTGVSSRFNDLAASGIRLGMIGNVRWTATDIVDVIRANQAGMEWFEGQNEADIFVTGDWVTADRTFQMLLWNTVKESEFFNLPVLDPALARAYRYATLGDLSAFGNFGNIHPYPGAKRPLMQLGEWLTNAGYTSGTLPLVATETGYHSALKTTNGHLPISERGAGKYTPRLLLDFFAKGIQRTYIYQLFDHLPPSTTSIEANFGLVRYNFSVRPAFTNLKNLIAILQDYNSPVPGGMLNFTLSGSTKNVKSALLQKTDGRFYLVLWQDVTVWNTSTRRDINNAPVMVTVGFDSTKELNLYQPSIGASVRSSYTAASLNVSVPDEVIILEVAP